MIGKISTHRKDFKKIHQLFGFKRVFKVKGFLKLFLFF